MTLPVSGQIDAYAINNEEGYSSNSQLSLNDEEIRRLAERLSGQISYGDLHGRTVFRRPTTWEVIQTGGSYSNPTYAYNSSWIDLDTSSYAAVTKSQNSSGSEILRWSDFGTGTRTGQIHIYVYGACYDTAGSARSEIEISVKDVSGTAYLYSTGSGSPVIWGPDSIVFDTMTDCYLPGLWIDVRCTAERIDITDNSHCTCHLYDVVFIGT